MVINEAKTPQAVETTTRIKYPTSDITGLLISSAVYVSDREMRLCVIYKFDHNLTVSLNIYSAVSLIQFPEERWRLVGKERMVEMGVDGREMDESWVDIFDLLGPSLSP